MLEAGHRRQDRRVMLNVSWLDVKLGLRMLAKYPGLSVVAVVGMAVAIAIGAGSFAFISAMLDPTLPLEGGDRIVSLAYDRLDRGGQRRQVLHDFVMWREELKTVEHVGAFQEESRNLVGADGSTDLVTLAEMTASGFGVTGAVPCSVGRSPRTTSASTGLPCSWSATRSGGGASTGIRTSWVRGCGSAGRYTPWWA